MIDSEVGGGVRAHVADSWVRSAAAGVQADTVDAPITLADDVLRDVPAAHPLAAVFPLLEDVLGRAARDCDAIMAVSDAAGQLLWVCGSPRVLRLAETIGFVEGSNWDERCAGTNAPGMALALDRSITVRRRRALPSLGASLELRGHPHPRPAPRRGSSASSTSPVATRSSCPQTMAMVRAAARMAESELARELLVRGTRRGWKPRAG